MSPSNNNSTAPTHPLRLFLFDSPRTTCQLFYKLFQSHPQLGWGRSYHGFNGYVLYGPDRITLKLQHNPEAAKAYSDVWIRHYNEDAVAQAAYPPDLSSAVQKFESVLAGTEEEGKIFFGKEHTLCLLHQDLILETLRREDRETNLLSLTANPTYIPTPILPTLTPLMIIRHPLLIIDSLWRGQLETTKMLPWDEDFEFQSTLKWTRMIHQYFTDQLGITPIVVDSHDVMFNTRALTDKLCGKLGIDPEGVNETWDPVPQEYWPTSPVAVKFVGHLLSSKGVERPKEVRLTPVLCSRQRNH